jgi:signal transduction histidine kinase
MGVRVPLRTSGDRPGREAWPLLLLLLVVLVPTGFLLWFMSDAVARQSAASRQVTLESYRGQLRILRSQTDLLWQPSAARLGSGQGTVGQPAPERLDQRFARLILDDLVDGVVLLDERGRAAFPALVSARRLPAADQALLALERLSESDPARTTRANTVATLVNNYDAVMPAAQRLFVMGELRRLAPSVAMPTEAALRLSTQFIEAGNAFPEPGGFRPTLTPNVWALSSGDRRVIGLYRTSRLQAVLKDALAPLAPRGVRFVPHPPEAAGDQEAIAAGPSLPGWQISFVIDDSSPMDAAARARAFTYLWAGFAGIAVMALLGVVAGQTLRRQLRLARLKTDLTATVSHELRAPLASVRVLVDGLLADATFDPVKTREYLQLIAGEHARLSRVIENFLTFARLERGHERFALVPTHPSAVVTASVEAIRERIPSGCDLRVETMDGLPRILADPDALGTALVNLLDNALKFTPEEKHILVRAEADDRSVLLSVRDNGAGIPAGERRRIFRRFYRVDKRLARETAGVGLGLSIVALIVRAHGGEIEVSSEPGAGSTFALRLPVMTGGRL